MKKLEIIKDIEVNEKTKLKMLDLIKIAVENYPEFGKGFKGIRQGGKILDILDSSKDDKIGEYIEFEDVDFEALKKSVNENQYNPVLSKYLIPFIDAFEKVK